MDHTVVLISVTQEHIDKGVKTSCGSCPIAIAAKEVFIEGIEIAVGINCIGIDTYFVDVPGPARRFIRAFDDGKFVRPFSFEIDVPKRLVR